MHYRMILSKTDGKSDPAKEPMKTTSGQTKTNTKSLEKTTENDSCAKEPQKPMEKRYNGEIFQDVCEGQSK